MKRLITIFIIFTLALTVCAGASARDPIQSKIGDLKEHQATAHEAAELLRTLGYADDSSEIRGLSDIWHQAQDDIEFYETLTYVGTFKVTGYTIDTCGKSPSHPAYGVTASGERATPYYTAAANKADFAFGEQIYIDGLDTVLEVQDRGVSSGTIDVCMATVAECYAVTGWYSVYKAIEK